MRCRKKRLNLELAMTVVARAAEARVNGRKNRRERSLYFCRKCDAWHTSSLDLPWNSKRITPGQPAPPIDESPTSLKP